jgi:hypothetical protein
LQRSGTNGSCQSTDNAAIGPRAPRGQGYRICGLFSSACPPQTRHARAKARSASSRRCPGHPRSFVPRERSWMAGHRRAEATPSFGRLCPAMTIWIRLCESGQRHMRLPYPRSVPCTAPSPPTEFTQWRGRAFDPSRCSVRSNQRGRPRARGSPPPRHQIA